MMYPPPIPDPPVEITVSLTWTQDTPAGPRTYHAVRRALWQWADSLMSPPHDPPALSDAAGEDGQPATEARDAQSAAGRGPGGPGLSSPAPTPRPRQP